MEFNPPLDGRRTALICGETSHFGDSHFGDSKRDGNRLMWQEYPESTLTTEIPSKPLSAFEDFYRRGVDLFVSHLVDLQAFVAQDQEFLFRNHLNTCMEVLVYYPM